ncbi:hypothetical protein OUZ56_028731 [Daphnia magna]|uniref:Uncharacterized protein n=1 Tax=Daphnia magna TaxID=35525 RepID=A0ABR0B4V9_9CRUS|nr:hypothetical protein OUZ56_028731 [Daphnia magna]
MLFINSSSKKYKVFEISVAPPTFSVTSETLQCIGLLKLDCNVIDTHRSTILLKQPLLQDCRIA